MKKSKTENKEMLQATLLRVYLFRQQNGTHIFQIGQTAFYLFRKMPGSVLIMIILYLVTCTEPAVN